MNDEILRNTKILFDETSIHATDYSLVFFSFRHQATIQAFGLTPTDEITFEMVNLRSGTPDKLCGCFIDEGDMPRIDGVEPLLCFACDTTQPPPPQAGGAPSGQDPNGRASTKVRLTAANPIVILNAPQNVILRAHFSGPGLGIAKVWATLETQTQGALLPGQDGCLPDCCVHDPDSWEPTGETRCNTATNMVEEQVEDNCGNLAWREAGEIVWTATGKSNCKDTGPGDTYLYQYEEANQCGTTRWVDEEREWRVTGQERCEGGVANDYQILVEQETECCCGPKRWVDKVQPEGTPLWTPTGKIECSTIGADGTFTVNREQINYCGKPRWENDMAILNAVETGNTRCVGGTADTYQIQVEVVDLCGKTAWLNRDLPPGQNYWEYNGVTQCGAIGDDGKYQITKQEINYCGITRWKADAELADAQPTGMQICGPFDPASPTYPTKIEVQTECCCRRYIDGPELPWLNTGHTECGPINPDGTYSYRYEQTTICGDIRFVTDPTGNTTPTGVISCGPFNPTSDTYPVYKEVEDVNGNKFLVFDRNETWVTTGQTCGAIQANGTYEINASQTTVCGDTRVKITTATATATGVETCGPYDDNSNEYPTQIEMQDVCGNKNMVAGPVKTWTTQGAEVCGAIQPDGTYTVTSTQVSSCGDTRTGTRTLTATATGVIVCGPFDDVSEQYPVQVEMLDVCGNKAMIDGPVQTWTTVGGETCGAVQPDGTYEVTVTQTTTCGDTRVKRRTETAVVTGDTCGPVQPDGTYEVTSSVTTLCGTDTQTRTETAVVTGDTCGPVQADGTYTITSSVTTMCGTDTQTRTATATTVVADMCTSLGTDTDDYMLTKFWETECGDTTETSTEKWQNVTFESCGPVQANGMHLVTVTQQMACGETRTVDRMIAATASGTQYCSGFDDAEDTYQLVQDFVTACGATETVVLATRNWTTTATTGCGAINGNGEYTVQVTQTTECGDTRTVERTYNATPTGEVTCSDLVAGVNYYTVTTTVEDVCGNTASVTSTDYWTSLGNTRCQGGLEQVLQVTICGETRWENTGNSCGGGGGGGGDTPGDTTFPLPDGGHAWYPGYQPGDATVALKNCSGVTVGYVRPTGSSNAVIAGCSEDAPTIGYGG